MKPQVMTSEMDASLEAWARVRGALRSQTRPGRLPELDRAAGLSSAPTTASGTSRRRPASSAPGSRATTATRSASCSARTASRSAGSSSASPRERRCGPACRGRPGARAGAAGGSDGRPGRRPARLAARRPLHLRQLRRRQAERTRPCRGAAGGRGRAGHLQPAVPLRRRGPRQDPPDARDRLGGAPEATPRRGCSTSRPSSSCTASSRRCASRRCTASRRCSARSTC